MVSYGSTKCNIVWYVLAIITGLFWLVLGGSMIGDLLGISSDDEVNSYNDHAAWDNQHLCACAWPGDDGRVVDPDCSPDNVAKVNTTLAAMADMEVLGAGGHAETELEEIQLHDLGWPKHGYWNMQKKCDSQLLTTIFKCCISIFAFVLAMIRVFYVALIIPKENAALAQKVLIADSVLIALTGLVAGYIWPLSTGEPVFYPPRGPNGIGYVMGCATWFGWLVTKKYWISDFFEKKKKHDNPLADNKFFPVSKGLKEAGKQPSWTDAFPGYTKPGEKGVAYETE